MALTQIKASNITDGTVVAAEIGADAIDGTKIADNAVDSEHYTDASIDEAHIANDAVNFATHLKAGTDGELITWDASGNPAAVAVGTATHVLTSGGAGVAPTFAAAAGGGKLLAMFHSTATFGSTTISTSQNTWTDTAVTLTFTPTSTASKFFVYYGLGTSVQDSGTDGGYGTRIKKVQGATTYPTNLQDWASGNHHSGLYLYPGGLNATRVNWYYTFSGVDADAHTTASLTYTVQFGQYNISTLNVGNYYAARSQIVVLEVSTA